ncbi:MAG: NADPH-dependent FMN reductase [Candidatus Nanohalobium sp.]
MKFLIIVGTARKGRNTIHPARKAQEVFEERGHEISFFDPQEKEVPPLGNRTYVDSEEPVPEDIQELSREVKSADGVVIVTPEYNHSIPGILKTTLDYMYPEYDEKPFSFITDSAGGFGGVRGLQHLHDIVLELGGFIGPDLSVSNAGEVFPDDGELIDESYEERFENFVDDSVEFVQRMEKS